jgi:NAD(P)-dependent dehydrogenase (short-subunit alcohol dehydrogenase family)
MNLNVEPEWNWLQGRTALITGAANGLGRGMARKWAESGYVSFHRLLKHDRAHTGS